MACLRAGVLPELHVRVGCAGVGVESGVARQACVGVSGEGKGFGIGRVRSGKVFFKGEFVRLAAGVEAPVAPRRRGWKEVTSMSVNMEDKKIFTGSGGAVLEDVPHLTDWLPDLPVRIWCSRITQLEVLNDSLSCSLDHLLVVSRERVGLRFCASSARFTNIYLLFHSLIGEFRRKLCL
jgi:hypothetical protein